MAATDLADARQQLLRAPRTAALDAAALRQMLVDLHEFWLTTTGADLGITARSGFAIVAVGGLGRRELLPFSDLDLILLHDEMPAEKVAVVADGLWYPLWDANIALDHSVRTVPQAMTVAAEDVPAALGMLEARHIAGDEDLSSLLIGGVRTQWRRDVGRRFADTVEHAQQRWRRAGDIAHRAEPDLKHGRGGMRDVQLLDALAMAHLTDRMPVSSATGAEPDGGVHAAYRRLLDIRTEVHRVAGRPREQVRAQDADEIGAALRLGDRFDLARAISDAARTIGYSVDVGLRTAGNAVPRRGARLRRSPLRRPVDEGVVEHHGEIVLARNAIPSRDPGLIMRVASSSARTGLPISASTLGRLADHAPEPRTPWPREALDDLLTLLGSGHHMVDPIEALDRTGLWGRLVPEWGAVRDLPPRDAIHTWTVDRHLVETAAFASALTTRVSRPDLLLLGALLHDIGKGRDADHSVVGADLATAIGRRIGLWPADIETLSAMVRHHLLLPTVATRRDLEDPQTAADVVETLDGDRVLLELLAALAEADSLATGPGVWGEWKASLIGDLVRRCTALLDSTAQSSAGLSELDAFGPDDATWTRLRQTAESGTITVTLTPSDRMHAYEVTIVAPDRRGLLSKAAGVLAFNGLAAVSASVRSHAGAAANHFIVSPTFGSPPDAGLLRQQLIAAIEGRLDVGARLDRREAQSPVPTVVTAGGGTTGGRGTDSALDSGGGASGIDGAGYPKSAVPALFAVAPTRVRWLEGVSPGEPILELRTVDRLGLLSRVSAVLEAHDVDVRWAKAVTMGASVLDTFAIAPSTVVDASGRERPGADRAVDPQLRADLENAIIAVCLPERPTPTAGGDDDPGGRGVPVS